VSFLLLDGSMHQRVAHTGMAAIASFGKTRILAQSNIGTLLLRMQVRWDSCLATHRLMSSTNLSLR
jgi:hypothetical protein